MMKSSIRPLLVAYILIAVIFSLSISEPVAAQPGSKKNGQLVSIDFNNVDIVVFIKFMSDLTKKNFIIDDKVKGKVTIISPGRITVDEAYRVFLSVLEVHGYTTVPSGKITKIVPSPEARSKSIKTRIQEESGIVGDNVVTQIIRLRYADPNEIKKLFAPLVSKNSVILAYPPTNTLIVTDAQSNIKRLQHILKAIDITGVGQQIAIIPVEYADAKKMVTILSSIFNKKRRGKNFMQKDITFVADERTNSIVLLASEGDTDNIRQLIKDLDKETPKGQAKIHVYYLENANAEELAKVLKDIPQKKTATKTTGKKSAPVISDKVRISADKATNSLIIMADMEDYVVLEDIIRKMDIPRSMVYIEALIMEVNVTKNFRLGTEWIGGGRGKHWNREGFYGGGFSAGGFGGDPGTVGTSLNTAGVPIPPGFSMGVIGETINIGGVEFPTITAIIQAYKKDSDVNILSTPQILTTDNQEAKIYVGSNIPFQTQATANDSGSTVYNSFEYRDVGKTLKITPHISKDRLVRLELSLEVSDISGAQTTQPTTSKRTVETTAIVKDKHTVVLGGLIDDKKDKTTYKVPCLGDIPGLGFLFRQESDSNEKTNLYVFLTPRVIQSPNESDQVTKEKRDHIEKLRESNIKLYKKNQKPEDSTSPDQSKIESFQYREEKKVINQPAPSSNPSPTGQVEDSADVVSSADIEKTSAGLKAEPSPQITVAKIADTESSADVSKDASKPNPKISKKAARDGGGYTVQVASVPSVEKADKILKKLNKKGYAAYTVQSSVGDKTWYRIRIGYFENPEATKPLMERLNADHYDSLLIKF